MPEDKIQKLKDIVALLQTNSPTKEEVAKIMATFVKSLKDQAKNFYDEIDRLEEIVKRVKAEKGDKGDKGDKPSVKELLSLIVPLIPEVENGIDGKDADPKEVAKLVEKDIVLDLPKYGIQFRDGLELLQGEDRLDKDAIKGLDELVKNLETQISIGKTKGGGSMGLRTFVGGSKKGLLQSLDFKAGSGMTLTYSIVNGLPTITFASSGGGGGGGWETPAGTVDGVNTTFTVSNEPVMVFVDGIGFVAGFGYTYLTGTLTMDTPPKYFIRSSF